MSPFDEMELAVLFEAARMALADADTFDYLVEQLDCLIGCLPGGLTDDERLSALREKLQSYLEGN